MKRTKQIMTIINGKALLVAGKGRSGIGWTGAFPTTNYEVSVEMMRTAGRRFPGMIFTVGDDAATWALGGADGKRGGVSVDGEKISDISEIQNHLDALVEPNNILAIIDTTDENLEEHLTTIFSTRYLSLVNPIIRTEPLFLKLLYWRDGKWLSSRTTHLMRTPKSTFRMKLCGRSLTAIASG